MVAFSLIVLQTVFLFQIINGMRYVRSCPSAASFSCDSGHCINKNQWCDHSNNCNDNSDEKYCRRGYSNERCNNSIHFRCISNGMCIPIEGHCDGYASCADLSDEKNCLCEERLDAVGNIEHRAFIGEYRTQHRCWNLVLNEGQYINGSIGASLRSRGCNYGNITVEMTSPLRRNQMIELYGPHVVENEGNFDKYDIIICPGTEAHRTFTSHSDVKICYRSSWYTPEVHHMDVFNITYYKVDMECLNPASFKCSEYSCIKPENQCDGKEDCQNGLDEQNCDFSALSAIYLKNNRENATVWMRRQHDADWGWKGNTHKAVVALYLDDDLTFKGLFNHDDLIAKQLELEVSAYLLRSENDNISPTELSAYINALLAICHNPRNFYGFDLVKNLKEEIQKVSDYVTPLPWLTLCNAKESVSEKVVGNLLQTLQKTSDHGFILEIQALTVMALSCISKDGQYLHLKQNVTEALNNLKLEQREDGSFGNEYTTALVLQALIANDQANDKNWNFKSSIEFLRKMQRTGGSYGDFLTTYLVMPVLNSKSLVDLRNVNCTKDLIRPKEGSLVSDIKSRLGGKIPVKYSLYIGDQKDQVHPIFLRAPENITALELMALAADIDPKYTFKTHEIKKKTYVYEILNIPNDPENNKFWFLYQDVGNDTIPFPVQAPDEIHVHDNDHIIMWYKTLNVL